MQYGHVPAHNNTTIRIDTNGIVPKKSLEEFSTICVRFWYEREHVNDVDVIHRTISARRNFSS